MRGAGLGCAFRPATAKCQGGCPAGRAHILQSSRLVQLQKRFDWCRVKMEGAAYPGMGARLHNIAAVQPAR